MQRLGGNALSLIALQAINHGPSLVAVAFASRALGPASFGSYAQLVSAAAILALLVDFGFNLSAVRAVAQAPADRVSLAEIFSSVVTAKLAIAGCVFALALPLVSLTAPETTYAMVVLAVLVAAIALPLTPVWLFYGLQRVSSMLVPYAACRIGAAAAVPFLVTARDDVLSFALINAVASIVLMMWVWLRARDVVGPWVTASWLDVRKALGGASGVFIAGLATNAYTASTTLIVSLALGNSAAGQFAIADRVRQMVLGLLAPVSQAVFPLACRFAASGSIADGRMLRRAVLWLLLLGALLWALLFFAADLVVTLIGGEQYFEAVDVLRTIAVLAFLVTLSTALGSLLLVANGYGADLAKVATLAAVFGIPSIYFLSLFFGLQGTAIALVATEIVAAVALLVTCRGRRLLRKGFFF